MAERFVRSETIPAIANGNQATDLPTALSASAFPESIVFGAPSIGEEEINEVLDTLRSGWLGTGPKTHQFEHKFANYVGKPFALGTNSGTAALHLALNALDVGPGDEVVTTPLTFAATANVIEHCGATPVFVDVRLPDGNIDPARVVEAVTPRTKVVLPVHYAGSVSDVPALRAALPDVPIVVDAAHAIEARYADGSRSAGHGAVATAYSFYVTKNLATGEGGMLVTDDEELAAKVRVRSLHGLDSDAWKRYSNGGLGTYQVAYPGFKYNMTDMQASLGIHQLARIEQCWLRRTEIWGRYIEAFCGLEGIDLPQVSLTYDLESIHAKHLFTIWCDWEALDTDRNAFTDELRTAGIGTGWHFPPLHLQPYYQLKYGHGEGAFPVAEHIASRTLSLPLSPRLTDIEVERVISCVRMLAGCYD